MNFLEGCQFVVRESGTISGTLPTAVTGQTGRLAKVVYWYQQAWLRIQKMKTTWRWMRAEFEGNLSAGTARYTGASFNLTRLAAWIKLQNSLTIYKQSTGVSDEGPLTYLPFMDYRAHYERGSQTANRPTEFSISDANELCFGPKPDAIYVARGMYRKSAQTLTANGDIPELPSDYHDVIGWYALLLLAEHDEGVVHVARAKRNFDELMNLLETEQTIRQDDGDMLPPALA